MSHAWLTLTVGPARDKLGFLRLSGLFTASTQDA